MRVIYFIMPVSSDSDFMTKRRSAQRVLDSLVANGHFPMEKGRLEEDLTVASIVAEMAAATQIVADLALERPSCYFEVGVAQAAGLTVDLIAPTDTPIHQVVGRRRVHYYSSPEEYEALLHQLLSRDSA